MWQGARENRSTKIIWSHPGSNPNSLHGRQVLYTLNYAPWAYTYDVWSINIWPNDTWSNAFWLENASPSFLGLLVEPIFWQVGQLRSSWRRNPGTKNVVTDFADKKKKFSHYFRFIDWFVEIFLLRTFFCASLSLTNAKFHYLSLLSLCCLVSEQQNLS